MANYYCMIAGLPDIDLKDAKPGLSIEEMREMGKPVAFEASADERDVRGLISMMMSRSVTGSCAH